MTACPARISTRLKIREFVQVDDLAHARVLAVEYLMPSPKKENFNLGTKTGISVFQTIKAVVSVAGTEVAFALQGHCQDVPIYLVANTTKNPEYQRRHFSIEKSIAPPHMVASHLCLK